MPNSEVFIANRDVMDSLRLELSTIDPEFQENLGGIAKDVATAITDEYAQFMPPSHGLILEGIEDRILLLEKKPYELFYRRWGRHGYDGATGCVMKQGMITAVKDPYELWKELDEERRQIAVEAFGTAEEAKEEISTAVLINGIGHETIHQFQDWDLPEIFQEMAVPYYSQRVLERIGYQVLPASEAEINRANAYAALLELRFPKAEDIHKLFFGAHDPEVKQLGLVLVMDIIGPFLPALFPKGYGGRYKDVIEDIKTENQKD